MRPLAVDFVLRSRAQRSEAPLLNATDCVLRSAFARFQGSAGASEWRCPPPTFTLDDLAVAFGATPCISARLPAADAHRSDFPELTRAIADALSRPGLPRPALLQLGDPLAEFRLACTHGVQVHDRAVLGEGGFDLTR